MPARPTVSAVLIVKDEEQVLDACLESVAWADQVVVYDTGSVDASVAIARRHGALVVEGWWDDDFGAARNRALAHATGDWVLSIDADEVFEGDPDRMRELLGHGGVSAHTILQRNLTGTARLPLQLGRLTLDAAVTRVFLREVTRWQGALHEQPVDQRGAAYVRVTALPNVALLHTGYIAEVAEAKSKLDRNLTLARAQVEQGEAAGLGAAEMEPRRVHLARSLVAADEHVEALAAAEAIRDTGFVRATYATILARAVIASAAALGDLEAQDRWLRVWEENDANPAFALAARARMAAARGDAREALQALERVPTTVVDAAGNRLDRSELVVVEVWARAAAGDRRGAVRTALEAARRGVVPGAPAGLVSLLGEQGTRSVLAEASEAMWRGYVTWCAMDTTIEARTFLRWMRDVRPGDPAVIAAAALLAPTMTLEEAAEWSAHLRGAGAAEQCPLVLIAADPHADPRQRALAGALAYSAYADERGLAGLADALERVRAEDEAELLAELAIVAPGLVGAAV